MKPAKILVFVIAIFSTLCHAAEPTLFIKNGNQQTTYTRTQLLQRKDIVTITTSEDPTFPNKRMVYSAFPAAALFKGITIPADAVIHFYALDDFSAPIAKDLLLNTTPTGSVAYIAIEKPNEKWPAIKPGVDDRTSAPFYLIWQHPKKSRVSPELWVMQLAGFAVEQPFEKLYPHVMPAAGLADNDPIMVGFKTFKTNCFSCHTINREGNGKIGPDLNVPHNPTEYLKEEYLRMFIRNPQNVRHWPMDKMMGFPPAVISDAELDGLIAYLKHMKERKVN